MRAALTRLPPRVAELGSLAAAHMSSKNRPMTSGLPTTSFCMEEGILICSGPGMAERRIAIGEVSGWLCKVESDPPVFQLLMKGAPRPEG
jgi:hypothetical protein